MVEPRIYRASSLGYSLCQLVCPYLGYEAIAPPDYLQAAFDEGNRLESIVIDKLRGHDWQIMDEQLEVELDVIPDKVKVVGHIDGKCVRTGGTDIRLPYSVLEIKTMAHKSFEDWKANLWNSKSPLIEKYKWQASAYMLATGLPHQMFCYDKQTEAIKGDWVSEPFYSISDIALKLQLAEDHIAEGKIPEGCIDYPCPYFYLHGGNDSAPPEPADPELDALLSAWMVADKAVKAYEGERKALREMIVEYAGETIAGKIKGSQGVTVSTVYQEESEYVTKKKAGWVTRVQGPRKGRNVTE